MYTITPFVLALGLQREKSRFTYFNGYGEKIDIPYISWLIRGNGLNVLVDSGCSAEQYKSYIRPAQGALHLGGEAFKDVVDVTPLEEALKKEGLGPDDIDVFIQTHLDWDHSMNTPLFKKSRVVIQKTELDDHPGHELFRFAHVPEETFQQIKALNLDVVDGDVEIAPGLSVMLTPGHTAGGQSVKVDTKDGTYVISGLCTVLDNYFVKPEIVAEIGYDIIPPGTHLDARLAHASCKRIRDEAGENVLPPHEPSFVNLQAIG